MSLVEGESALSIYLSLSNKWKPCPRAINSWPRNLRTALEKYFRFQKNCKQLQVEERSNIGSVSTDYRLKRKELEFFCQILYLHLFVCWFGKV